MDIFSSWIGMLLVLAALALVGALALFAIVSALTVIGMLVGALALPSNDAT